MTEPVSDIAEPTPPAQATQVRFTGTGAEYFRIWSVNLTLTILTLGLYSAWAKVRRLQYFYRNTELDGAVFDYTASPLAILLGRVIALALLVGYYLSQLSSRFVAAGVTVLLVALLPFLLWQSNRFKARNTRYRGVAFSFAGSLGDAYRVYLPALVVAFAPVLLATLWLDPRAKAWGTWVSFGALLMLPVLHAMYRRYVQANLRFGDTPILFEATANDFVAVWMWGLAAMIASAIAIGMVLLFVGGVGAIIAGKGRYGLFVAFSSGLLGAWLAYVLIGSYFTARFQQLVWEKTRIGSMGLACDISASTLLGVQAMNTLWVILTLGAFRPFAAIRLARYRLESMTALNVASLAQVSAAPKVGRSGAAGESAADIFNMELGL